MAFKFLNDISMLNDGYNGTNMQTFFSCSSANTLAEAMTAGAVADAVTAGRVKVGDVLYLHYDIDGTPGYAELMVTSTSGGSLVYRPSVSVGVLYGIVTWAGGSTSNAFTCTGVLTTDTILVTMTGNANASSITKVIVTANTLTVTFSADPGSMKLNWQAKHN